MKMEDVGSFVLGGASIAQHPQLTDQELLRTTPNARIAIPACFSIPLFL